MAQKIQSPTAHAIVLPTSTQPYHGVFHADSGREVVRCATYAEALKEQARLNALDSK